MVRVLKFSRFIIDKPFFDPNPNKSTTNNQTYRKVLIMVFLDHWGNEHFFMPRWADILELNTQSLQVEVLNKSLLKEQLIEQKNNTGVV